MHLLSSQPSRRLELKTLIDRYDNECELFDEHHDLPPSKRQFFYYKGKCFEAFNQLDSAEHYYRKVFRPNMKAISRTAMMEGLLSVFKKRHLSDSIAKYAELYCAATDSSAVSKDSEITAQLTASYNYSHYQKEARENEQKVTAIRFWWMCTIFITTIVLSVVVYGINRYRKQQQERQREIKRKHEAELMKYVELYKQRMEELQQVKNLSEDYQEELDYFRKLDGIHKEVLSTLQQELSTAEGYGEKYKNLYAQSRQEISTVIAEYESKQELLSGELAELKLEASSLKRKIDGLLSNGDAKAWMENSRHFSETPIYKRIKSAANHPLERIREYEWQELCVAFNEHFPVLYQDLNQRLDKNGQLKFRVCILTAMGLRNGEQACLLDKPKQTITNNMSALNKMLFGENSSRTFYKNLVNTYNICF